MIPGYNNRKLLVTEITFVKSRRKLIFASDDLCGAFCQTIPIYVFW